MDIPATIERHFHPVLPVEALGAAPRQVILRGEPYVLWRGPEGRIGCTSDRCAHRLAPLSEGRVRSDGRIACPYHGWHFGTDGAGDSPHVPGLANCRVRAMSVVERHGYVWIAAPGTPDTAMPEMGWPEWEFASHTSVRFPAPLHVCLDNFTENEHTPWVHRMLGWEEQDADKVVFGFTPHPDHTHVTYDAPQRPSPWLPFLGVKAGDTFHNDWVTRFAPIHSVYTISWSERGTARPRPLATRFCIFMVPESDTVTVYHSFLFVKIAPSLYRYVKPVVKRVAAHLGATEIGLDAAFIRAVADTPFEMKGMRLTRYDHPLIAHRKMIRRLYWGERAETGRADSDGSAVAH